MVVCIEKLRMDIFELQYARKAISESSLSSKIKELQEKKMRKRKRMRKGKDR
jgi:DNA-binding HxlR family transcriptional regulator